MTEALEQANLDMGLCSLVDLYLRTVVLLPCNTQSHMSCSRPLMQLQQPLTSPRGMWRMELSIALLAEVFGGHQLFLLLHCRALRVLEVVTVLLHRTGSLQERPIDNFTRLAQLWFHCMPPLKQWFNMLLWLTMFMCTIFIQDVLQWSTFASRIILGPSIWKRDISCVLLCRQRRLYLGHIILVSKVVWNHFVSLLMVIAL